MTSFSRLRVPGILLLLAMATATIFWRAWSYGFIQWDDNILVYDNPYLNPATAAKTWELWRQPYEMLYMPMTYTAWAILALLGPAAPMRPDAFTLNPHVFHAANILLHILNVWLVFAILRRLMRLSGNTHNKIESVRNGIARRAPRSGVVCDCAAAGGALLFGLHPLQVEPVVWVSELKGVLCGFFSLLALWQYLHYAALRQCADGGVFGQADTPFSDERESNSAPSISAPPIDTAATPRLSRLHYTLATVAFTLALLSKPSAVTVPLVAWVLDSWMLRRPARCSARSLSGWLALSLLFVGVAHAVQPVGDSVVIVPLWARPLVAGDALGFYLSKLALPWGLAPDYGRSPDWVMQHAGSQPLWMIPAVLGALIWWQRARWPCLVAAGALSVCSVLPVLGLAPFRFQSYSTVADRYCYVAMLGPALALACALARLSSSPTPDSQRAARQAKLVTCAAPITCVLIALGALSVAQTGRWRSTSALFEHTLRVNSQSYLAHTILGNERNNAGDTVRAEAHYRRAIAANPRYAMAHNNLGLVLAAQDKNKEALLQYREALRYQPFYPDARLSMGVVWLRQGRLAPAGAAFREVLRIAPGSAKARLNLGVVAEKQGRLDAATAFYREALRLEPKLAQAHFALGNVLRDQHQPDEALAHWQEALRLKPDYVEAHLNAGLVLCTRGDVAGARAHWQEALRLKPDYAPVRQAMQRFTGR